MPVETIPAAVEQPASQTGTTVDPKTPVPGQESTPAAPAEATDETQPDATTADPNAPETAEAEPKPEETEVDLDEVPERSIHSKYSDAYKLHPELRSKVARHDAFTELFPDFQEARQLAEMIPTLADAERMVEEATQYRQSAETLQTDPGAYIDGLRERDPIAYTKLISSLPEHLAATDQRSYVEHARYFVNLALENIYQDAVSARDEAAVNSIRSVAQMWGVNLGFGAHAVSQRNDPTTIELEKLRKEKAERDRSEQSERVTEFKASVDESFQEQSKAAIGALVDKSGFSDTIKATITTAVWSQLQEQLKAQPQLVAEVNRAWKAAGSGRVALSDQKRIVDFIVSRAKSRIPVLYKAEAAKWSKEVVRKNQTDIARSKEIANKTKDAGSGATTTTGPVGKPRPTGPRTTDQVYAELSSGTYQRPAAP